MEEFMNIRVTNRGCLQSHTDIIPYEENDDLKKYKKSGYCVPLSGDWKFSFYEHILSVPENFYEYDYDYETWDDIDVPSCWQMRGYGLKQYINNRYPFPADPPYVPMENNVGCYRREFEIPQNFEGKKVHILFDGVCSAFHVWVNGNDAGFSQGSHMPSEFDITEYIQEGKNVLAVKVYQYSFASYLECQDMWRFNGIFRGVYLIAKECCEFYNIETNASLDETGENGEIQVVFSMTNPSEAYIIRLSLEYKGKCIAEKMVQADKKVSCHIAVEKPYKWTAETPDLYQLKTELIKDGKIAEIYYVNIGFRKIEIRGNKFLVNGQPIKIKGVNHHDTSPDNGYTMSPELIEKDIMLMKQHNINAVRTSHYPPDTYLLDMCDKYGIYVIDEADLETHGGMFVGEWNCIADDDNWKALHIDRAERMVKRDINHPSVIMWSIGNESGEGKNHAAMAEYIKKYDPTRPVHYECAKREYNKTYFDVYSEMYPELGVCEEYAKKEGELKPMFLCEYAHSMGNSPGALKEYMDLFYKYDRMMGGCIWEWADHGIVEKNSEGKPCFRYGGDYGGWLNDGNFCCDGLCFPDRTPHTGMLHMKNIFGPVDIKAYHGYGSVELINRYDIINLDNILLEWELTENGEPAQSGTMGLPQIRPHQSGMITILYDEACIKSDKEYFLNMYFKTKTDSEGIPKGYEVCRRQIKISGVPQYTEKSVDAEGVIKTVDAQDRVIICGENFSVNFSKIKGTITDYIYEGKQLIKIGPIFNIFRPMMDNDWCFGNDDGFFKIWENAGIDHIHQYVREVIVEKSDNQSTEIICRAILATPSFKPMFEIVYTWDIFADGRMSVKLDITPREYKAGENIPFVPKLGTQSVLPDNMDNVQWYGRGPIESYSDKNDAALVGKYSMNIDDLFENHINPQENGNRSEVRWVNISDKSGYGLHFSGDRPMNFSARFYTDKELNKKKHSDELERISDCIFNFDYETAGVGTGSCGPKTLDKYRVRLRKVSFNINIKPIKTKNRVKKEEIV